MDGRSNNSIVAAAIVVVLGATGCASAASSDSVTTNLSPTSAIAIEPTPAVASEAPAPEDQPEEADPIDTPEAALDESPEPTEAAVDTERPAAPNGRTAPAVATGPVELAAQVAAAERGLLDPASTAIERAEWGHVHQVAIRKLGYEPDWDIAFFEALPPEFRDRTRLHISARRALIDLSSGYDAADFIPAWLIVEAEPASALLSYYQEAEAATGIEWEFLAAINLIETGMGRIRGLSSAGAQGPMQFLPTTWNEAGIGEGDINDPHDAIQAAARYLVRRGGPDDMDGAIWGYNNSDDYVTAVQSYAALLRADPAAYEAIYNWEIYFYTEAGDVWLPAGFSSEASVDLDVYLESNPWSEPDPGLR